MALFVNGFLVTIPILRRIFLTIMRAICGLLRFCNSIGPEGTSEHDYEWRGKQGCMIRFEWRAKRMSDYINVKSKKKSHRDQRGRHEPK